MKTIILIITVSFMFFLGSCNYNTPTDNNNINGNSYSAFLISPADDYRVDDSHIANFSWSPIDGCSYYLFSINDPNSGATLFSTRVTNSSLSFNFSYQNYHLLTWKVTTVLKDGTSFISGPRRINAPWDY